MSAMRIGGLASGMDIDSIVEKLMMVERMPLDKLEQKKQTYEWQRDAYRDVNTKIQTLDTYIADNLIINSLNAKTATSSNSEYVSATATGSASGTLSIEGVSRLATAARSVGEQINATGSTTLGELGITDTFLEIRAIQKDGTLATTKTKIEFTSETTVNEFISKLNGSAAGVSAVFENGRLSITAKNTGDVKTGSGAEIVVDSGNAVFEAFKMTDTINLASGGMNAIFQVNGIATERASNSFSIMGYSVTLKKTFNGDQTTNEMLTAAFNERINANEDLPIKQNNLVEKKSAYNDAKSSYDNEKQKMLSSLSLEQQTLYSSLSSPTILAELNTTQLSMLKAGITSEMTEEEKNKFISSLAEGENAFSPELKTKLTKINVNELRNIANLTEGDFSALSAVAELEKTYNALNKNFLKNLSTLINENFTYEDLATEINKLDFNSDDPLGEMAEGELKDVLSSISTDSLKTLQGLTATQLENFSQLADKEIALAVAKTEVDKATAAEKVAITRQENAEASYKLLYKEHIYTGIEEEFETTYAEHISSVNQDWVEYKNDPIDNPKPEAPQLANPTPSNVNPVTMTSTTNVAEMITKIKDFVTTYNGLIKDLNNLIKESKYRDFPPLTSAQRKDMEENEIKLWEEKAKSGLLRGDSIIQSGLSSMRSLIYQTNDGVLNTKFNTLYSVGITTSRNYMEGGTLEIDENKLRKALEEDPDAVATLFSNPSGKVVKEGNVVVEDTRGYLQKLRASFDEIQQKIETRAGRSTMTQTQYTLGKYLKNVEDQMDNWQDKLRMIENRYWAQFGAMESMINKANSQSAMLMGQYY